MNIRTRTAFLFVAAMAIVTPIMATAGTTVVNHWGPAGHGVTTVHTHGPYYGVHPAPCCYGGGVVAGVAAGLVAGTVAAAMAPKPVVVYAPPPVVTYTPPVVYAARPVYIVP